MDIFAGAAIALYVGHHVGDYWVQRDADAACKGNAGAEGVRACLNHVISYVITQGVCVLLVALATGEYMSPWLYALALLVSGVFHYAADRREHGIMFRLARIIPGKAKFLTLGVPRAGVRIDIYGDCGSCKGTGVGGDEISNGRCYDCYGGGRTPIEPVGDNPSLGTGAWALDQSWHLATSVFLPALLIAALS